MICRAVVFVTDLMEKGGRGTGRVEGMSYV